MKIPAVLHDAEDEGPQGRWRPPQAPGRGAPPPPSAAPSASAFAGMPAAGGEAASQVPSFLRMPVTAQPSPEGLSPEVEAELAAVAAYGEEDPCKPDAKRDTYVPVALLAVGFVLTVLNFAWSMDGHHGAAVAGGIVGTVFNLVVGLVLMLLGALLAAKFAGINFGSVGPAILKLAGLCLAPGALGDLVTTLLGGDMAVSYIGWAVQAVMYYALISYLFRLDGGQTVVVVFAITIVKVVLFFVLGAALLVGMGSMIEDAGDRVRHPGGGQGSSMTSHHADDDDD
jgi:hypothetical protein